MTRITCTSLETLDYKTLRSKLPSKCTYTNLNTDLSVVQLPLSNFIVGCLHTLYPIVYATSIKRRIILKNVNEDGSIGKQLDVVVYADSARDLEILDSFSCTLYIVIMGCNINKFEHKNKDEWCSYRIHVDCKESSKTRFCIFYEKDSLSDSSLIGVSLLNNSNELLNEKCKNTSENDILSRPNKIAKLSSGQGSNDDLMDFIGSNDANTNNKKSVVKSPHKCKIHSNKSCHICLSPLKCNKNNEVINSGPSKSKEAHDEAASGDVQVDTRIQHPGTSGDNPQQDEESFSNNDMETDTSESYDSLKLRLTITEDEIKKYYRNKYFHINNLHQDKRCRVAVIVNCIKKNPAKTTKGSLHQMLVVVDPSVGLPNTTRDEILFHMFYSLDVPGGNIQRGDILIINRAHPQVYHVSKQLELKVYDSDGIVRFKTSNDDDLYFPYTLMRNCIVTDEDKAMLDFMKEWWLRNEKTIASMSVIREQQLFNQKTVSAAPVPTWKSGAQTAVSTATLSTNVEHAALSAPEVVECHQCIDNISNTKLEVAKINQINSQGIYSIFCKIETMQKAKILISEKTYQLTVLVVSDGTVSPLYTRKYKFIGNNEAESSLMYEHESRRLYILVVNEEIIRDIQIEDVVILEKVHCSEMSVVEVNDSYHPVYEFKINSKSLVHTTFSSDELTSRNKVTRNNNINNDLVNGYSDVTLDSLVDHMVLIKSQNNSPCRSIESIADKTGSPMKKVKFCLNDKNEEMSSDISCIQTNKENIRNFSSNGFEHIGEECKFANNLELHENKASLKVLKDDDGGWGNFVVKASVVDISCLNHYSEKDCCSEDECYHNIIWGHCFTCKDVMKSTLMRELYSKEELCKSKYLFCRQCKENDGKRKSKSSNQEATVKPFIRSRVTLQDDCDQAKLTVNLSGDDATLLLGVEPNFKFLVKGSKLLNSSIHNLSHVNDLFCINKTKFKVTSFHITNTKLELCDCCKKYKTKII